VSLVKHPAKYADVLLPVMAEWLQGCERVLDPFGGVGKLVQIAPNAYLNELEPEWAQQCYMGSRRTTIADARKLPYPDAVFDAVCTSPTWGNRMADHHDAKEKCSRCKGIGMVYEVYVQGMENYNPYKPCYKCGCTGYRSYKRNTYRHLIGRPLHQSNSGKMQWGDDYRRLHLLAWAEVWRVLKPGGWFILNISNHIRKGNEIEVTEWHEHQLAIRGFEKMDHKHIKAPRQRQGANRQLRVDYESLILFQKPIPYII
jgi:SAM-dependent methyltransferase